MPRPLHTSLAAAFVLASLVLLPHGAARAADAKLEANEEEAFKQAAALVGPSVVQIRTAGGRDVVGQVITGTGPTTGVIVSKDGYIVSSSFNFIAKPSTILVNLPDGRKNLLAKIVATDHSKMLALLKIDAKDLPVAPAAPKKSIKVGHWSIALGRTFSLEVPSLSVGIISATGRIWGRALQTDAKISPVNYGGPLVSVEGKVQGILVPLSIRGHGETAGVEWYDSGIGFAIPMEDVNRAVERLKKGKDLHPGLMGITFKGTSGLLGGDPVIDRVRSGSPAAQAGLKPGDRILQIDGTKTASQNAVKHALGPKYAGDVIAVTVKRGDKTIPVKLTLVEKLTAYVPPYLGVLPARVFDREAGKPGVLLRHVFKGGPADKAGLKDLDRIVKFNGKEVADAASLADLVSRLKPKAKAAVEFLHGNDRKTATVELTTIPNDVVAQLDTAVLLPGKGVTAKTGRITVKMPKHEREYWAYIPRTYNPKYRYGLMVWIHPSNDTMEATIFKQWQRLCDERGLMMIGPKAGKLAGWTPNEAEFVIDAIDDFKDKYSVDSGRVFLHAFADGGKFAFDVAFKHRDAIRGVAVVGSVLRARPPEYNPQQRLQFHFVWGDQDPSKALMQRSVDQLRQLKYPASATVVKDLGEQYPKHEHVREIARWADCLDRI